MVVAVAAKAHWKNQSLHRPVAPELVVMPLHPFMAKPSVPRNGVPRVLSPNAIPYLQKQQGHTVHKGGVRSEVWGDTGCAIRGCWGSMDQGMQRMDQGQQGKGRGRKAGCASATVAAGADGQQDSCKKAHKRCCLHCACVQTTRPQPGALSENCVIVWIGGLTR